MRAALFDLDDTLLDRAGSLRLFAHWQATGMLRFSDDDAQKFVARFISLDQNGMVWKDKVYESLAAEFEISDWSTDELLTVYLLTFCAFCKPRPGAISAIEEFRGNGFRLGLVSNGKLPFQERNIRAIGFHEFFDCVIISEAVGIRKPDAAIFQLACRTLGADIKTSVFIGDNPISDIKGAKNAGMTTIYIPAIEDEDTCRDADFIIKRLSELNGFVNRQCR